MNSNLLENSYTGKKFTVVHCSGAIESFRVALNSLTAGKKRTSFTERIIQQINRLADGHPMSRENFPQEGELPKKKGQTNARKFNALKKIPIRGYCWLSEKHKNTYYISHYVYKDYDYLDPKDTGRVGANWNRIEVNGDEC